MADFNELCNLISYYRESNGESQSDEYNTLQEFKDICDGIKFALRENVKALGDARTASDFANGIRAFSNVKSSCAKLHKLADGIHEESNINAAVSQVNSIITVLTKDINSINDDISQAQSQQSQQPIGNADNLTSNASPNLMNRNLNRAEKLRIKRNGRNLHNIINVVEEIMTQVIDKARMLKNVVLAIQSIR